MSTVFEKIIAREIPASIIYEDATVIAFLDIKPNNKGHALVVPKEMFVNIFDADELSLRHMMSVAKKVADALVIAVSATGVNLVMNNGADAGQDVFHAHLHVIPRHTNDNVYQPPTHTSYSEGEADELATQLRQLIE